MTLGTREGLSPFEVLALDMQLDEEMSCEHSGHLKEPKFHGGPGEWYLQFTCPSCMDPTDVQLICDTFKVGCFTYGVVCDECGVQTPAGVGFTVVERK